LNNQQEELIVITELITAGSIREYLKKIHTPRLKVVKRWCERIIDGLDYLHQHDIIHGKLTCESIYINSNNGEIKIGDIGIKHVYAKGKDPELCQNKQF
jgi:WNK lysine deficient protein kinase